MLAITTRNLSRRFGKVTAVDNLNLKIEAGSLYGLIGPNGAGKTTTLRMLAGLLEPSSGEIRVNELPIRQYWEEIRWQIGYMPDFFGVYEDLLVWEYLDFFARCYRIDPERRKHVITDLLELVDLEQKRDEFVHTLSRGMRQRLCLAHALVHDPQVLLLDEPASGLDPRARVEMRELLRELRNMGKTIVLSSHILTELAELCDSIGIIERGRLVISGSMAEIRNIVQRSRMLRVSLLSDSATAKQFLSTYPGVLQVRPFPNNEDGDNHGERVDIEIEFAGDEAACADLLAELVRMNIKLAFFSEITTDLEDAFLHLTKGEVA